MLRKLIYILILLPACLASGLSAWSQDNIDVACMGDAGVKYGVYGFKGSVFEWTVEGGTIVRNYNDSIVVDWPKKAGVYTITVQEHTEFGCVSDPIYATVLVTGPKFGLEKYAEICQNQSYQFDAGASGDGPFIYQWQDGSNKRYFTTDSAQWVKVQVTDNNGCSISDSAYLTVHDLPTVNLGPDTTWCDPTQPLKLDAGFVSGALYRWSNGSGSQSILVYKEKYDQEVYVEVTDENSCVNSDTILVKGCLEGLQDITNVFTPNGDNVNDVWQIKDIEYYPEAVVEVFDRWGRLVYRSNGPYDNASNAWDGTDRRGKPLPMDSYYYVITYHTPGVEPATGEVTIVR